MENHHFLMGKSTINGMFQPGFGATWTQKATWSREVAEKKLTPSQGGSMRILDPCAKCLDSRYAKDWNKRDGRVLTCFEYL